MEKICEECTRTSYDVILCWCDRCEVNLCLTCGQDHTDATVKICGKCNKLLCKSSFNHGNNEYHDICFQCSIRNRVYELVLEYKQQAHKPC